MLISEAGERVLAGEESWNEYPRPQLKRGNWRVLQNGWTLDGDRIRIPFPPQSLLSGYEKEVGTQLEYQCKFEAGDWKCAKDETNGQEQIARKRTILHFGAVDQIAEVFLNEKRLGRHEGGYLPFSYDITDVLEPDNTLKVQVTDTLSHKYPYGKQRKKRGGMWYTPVSGIWQQVWMEQVPESYIKNIKITPDEHSVHIAVEMNDASAKPEGKITVKLHDGSERDWNMEQGEVYIDFSEITMASGAPYEVRMWSAQDPYLYRASIVVGEDCIETYFALRKIGIQNVEGVNRVCLNGKPIFLNGVLDQGYFCDGIYLPAEAEEYERDVLRMQELGFNMLRKHIKIEPECFYYYCDLHGMLVMQDMVNNGSYSFLRDTALPTIGLQKKNDTRRLVSKETKDIFIAHMLKTQEHLYNHPCIIAYTIFNEGWGQFESDRLYEMAKEKDNTRLYDATSGWFAQSKSDFDSYHVYFGDGRPTPKERPMLLSEFGGYSYKIPGHVFAEDKSYGYGACKEGTELAERIAKRYEELIYPVIRDGACGCVYTQVSDVEDEINGFYTYDRKVCKVKPEWMWEIERKIAKEMGSDK